MALLIFATLSSTELLREASLAVLEHCQKRIPAKAKINTNVLFIDKSLNDRQRFKNNYEDLMKTVTTAILISPLLTEWLKFFFNEICDNSEG
jgi:hypothetical protein